MVFPSMSQRSAPRSQAQPQRPAGRIPTVVVAPVKPTTEQLIAGAEAIQELGFFPSISVLAAVYTAMVGVLEVER